MDEYDRMKQQVAKTPELKLYFDRIHHFSSDKFKKKPSSYDGFVDYKEKPLVFQKNGENIQTVRRVLASIEAFKTSGNWDQAIVQAWSEFPLVTR